ncbi:PTS glucose transporter subunit IIA [Aestuariibacter sp. A3R04]|uniref:PTS glucose transporter subunit IIA n=1 Tax=Aestuariibacter sp. A3R04 TaxID=2841571 RepID=UPI001C08FFF3|nr:PTS glucose transporter subunit IIA [Aestuariibacter sp. A3R04]MBU3022609.1 PTS glucose transporter subunit IIA [Aestuariibacter sp. A3R04]
MPWIHQRPLNAKREIILTAPVNGTIAEQADVDALLVTSGLWGPACFFHFSGHTLFAPTDCKVVSLPRNGYEVTLKTPFGLKLWISLNLPNRALMGEKCEFVCREGQALKTGDPVFRFQLNWMKQNNMPTTGALTLVNGNKCAGLRKSSLQSVIANQDPLVYVYL